MNVQILPNWFKKISFIIFLATYLLSNGDDAIHGFRDGISGKSYNYTVNNTETPHLFLDMVGGENSIHWLKIISILALITYMLSKEKVEDDYISILRLESYQLTFLIITIVAFIFYLFKVNTLYGIYDSVTLFICLYLIIFFLKKRAV